MISFVNRFFIKRNTAKLVESYTENWDVERIAFMDMLILVMAITEAVAFPSIPTRVTINEYLEIAKFYSTEKSSVFINGLLDKIFKHLKDEPENHKNRQGINWGGIGERSDNSRILSQNWNCISVA